MKRRDLIAMLGGTTMAWSKSVRAQRPAGVKSVGVLSSGGDFLGGEYADAFRSGLKQTGYVEGTNLVLVSRWAGGKFDRLGELASQLVKRGVGVFAAVGDVTAIAAALRQVAPATPFVFLIGSDPVARGLVASLNRPGGNATGVTLLAAEIGSKRLGILRALRPDLRTVAVLFNPAGPNRSFELNALAPAAQASDVRLVVLSATTALEIQTALSGVVQSSLDGLLVTADTTFLIYRDQIIARVEQLRLPAVYPYRPFAAAGGLASYGADVGDSYRQVGIYLGRILNGTKPADLPVQQPTKFELTINLNTAKGLRLEIPPTLLAIADEVIE